MSGLVKSRHDLITHFLTIYFFTRGIKVKTKIAGKTRYFFLTIFCPCSACVENAKQQPNVLLGTQYT